LGVDVSKWQTIRETVGRYDKVKMSIVRVGVVQGAMIEHRKRTDGQMGRGIMGTQTNKGDVYEQNFSRSWREARHRGWWQLWLALLDVLREPL